MTYLYKKTNNPIGKTKYVVAFLIVIFFLLIKFTSLGGIFGSIFTPLFSVGDQIYQNIDNIPEKLWSKERLMQELEILREKEKDRNLELSDISALQSENRELRNKINLKPDSDFVSAFVIARPPQTSFDTIIINRGSKDNIAIGDLILASASTMVGKVVEVREFSSVVLLNSSPSAYFLGNISRNNVPIEVFGYGSGNLSGKVPIINDVEKGDTVVLNYGKFFSIGVIEEIESDEASGFKNLFISLPVNIYDLGVVFVLSPYYTENDQI